MIEIALSPIFLKPFELIHRRSLLTVSAPFIDWKAVTSQGAIDDYDQVIDGNPKDSEALRGRGYARLESHDPDAAIADLTAAIALNPTDALAYRFRESAHAAKRDSKHAEMDLAMVRKLEPSAH